MGSTGESYLVAMDKKMRSESRFIQRKKPIEIAVATEATKHVFDGKDSTGIINDYRGVKVVSVYRKINTPYLDFAIISEIDFEEAMAPVGRMRNYIVAIALLTLAMVVVLTVFISTSISKPILKLKDRIELLALGKIPALETKRPGVKEVSQISVAIDRLIFGYQQTANFADKIGSGYFTASFDTLSEFDVIGKSLIQMRDKLRELSEQQIKLSREKASALLQGQENERKRIVQDLHDGVGQHLTGIRLQVQALDDGKLKQALSLLIDETIKEVKQVSYDIMPSVMLDFGLKAALNGLCEHIKKYSSIYIDFTYVKEMEKNLPFEISIAVFRIVQEAFNNILKHADATKINFYVRKSETELYLFVEDNGKGFDATLSANGGLGLQGMTERTKLLNGIIEINSNVGVGTSIEVTIPVRI
jgi:signal transduction histidine kinase